MSDGPRDKAARVLRAHAVGIRSLAVVPAGTWDIEPPAEFWTNASFAKRWLISGGVAPSFEQVVRRAKRPRSPRSLLPLKLTKKLAQQCARAGKDYARDVLADGGDPTPDAARDIAHGIAESARLDGQHVLSVTLDCMADAVWDGVQAVVKRRQKH